MARAKAPARAAPWRNRIVGSGEEEPSAIVANPANWRTHGQEQRGALRGALGTVGWVQQVVINRRTGHLVDGHARVEEAVARKDPSVPVLYVDLSLEEEALVLATFDPLGAMAGRDEEKLGELLDGIRVDDEALRRLLGTLAGPEERRAGLTDPDEVPSAPEEPTVATGELWALGEHRLLIGDATSADDVARLTAEGQVDLLWTDPPYGVAYQTNLSVDVAVARHRRTDGLELKNDSLRPEQTRELVAAACRLAPLRAGGAFYLAAPAGPMHLEFMLALREAGLRLRQTIIWVKDRFVMGMTDFHYRHEPILYGDLGEKDFEPVLYGWDEGERHAFYGGRRLDTVWEIKRPGASPEHPTMKPVELVARALEYSTRPGDVVYDPFVGSGTTIIAAEQLGRRALALEIDPRYAQVSIERWEHFTGQQAERLEGPA
jgi:DNA modification methylase